MIQITPDNDSKCDPENDQHENENSESESDIQAMLQLNVSQQLQMRKLRMVGNIIDPLPESNEIEIECKHKEDTKTKAKTQTLSGTEIESTIEMPKEDSKTCKSFTDKDEPSELSATPIPKEFYTAPSSKNEDSMGDTRSFAVRLVNKDEPTLTDIKSNSTDIEDTYLKYLNM